MDIRRVVRNLKDEEEVRGVHHQFWMSLFWHWAGGIVVFFAPFFFFYLFLRWGTIGSVLIGVLLATGSFWLLRTYRLWRYTMLVISNERLIIVNQFGFFDRSVSQVELDKINDVSYRKKGLLQTICNYGTVNVQASGVEKVELKSLRHPSFVQQEIFDLQEEYAGREVESFSETDLLAIIREIRSRVGDRRWKSIVEGDWEVKQELIDEMKDEDTEKARAIEQFFSRDI